MSLAAMVQTQVYNAIKRVGAPVTIARDVPGDGFPDPATGEAPAGQTLTSASFAVANASTIRMGYKFGPDLVMSGDIELDVPAKGLTFEVGIGDQITFRNVPYTVKLSQPNFYGETPVLFALLVKR
jgi:hypothetical protein